MFPVLVVAIDADILVMLMNQANCTHGRVHMRRGLASCVNDLDILWKSGSLCTHGGVHMRRGLASCVNVLDILWKSGALKTCCPTMLFLGVTVCQCCSAKVGRPCCIK